MPVKVKVRRGHPPWWRLLAGAGVIKFWGPHENGDPSLVPRPPSEKSRKVSGDPGSPFSLVKWGPLWEKGDPHTVFVLLCIKYSQLSVGWFVCQITSVHACLRKH